MHRTLPFTVGFSLTQTRFRNFFSPRLNCACTLRILQQAEKKHSSRLAGCPYKYTPPAEMPVPFLLNTNIHSLFTKPQDLSVTLQTRIHIHTCVICIQESLLNSDVANALLSVQGFDVYRVDRQLSNKKNQG